MAAAGAPSARCLLSAQQFKCPICLDVFSQPVSIPCGHNFCKECIRQNWSYSDVYECPLCKRLFHTKPELFVNTLLAEMVAQFAESAQREAAAAAAASPEPRAAGEGEIPCDVCAEVRLKAVKSCLDCVASLCETHLEPHRRHRLIEPAENLEGRKCPRHDNKPLELFCRSDQTCVCVVCFAVEHESHRVVPLREEYEGRKAELVNVEVGVHRMIHERRRRIGDMKEWVRENKERGDRELAAAVQSFDNFLGIVEGSLSEVMTGVEEKQRATTERAEALIQEMERETSELRERSSELERLKRSDDPLDFLQSFPSLAAAPPARDWSDAALAHPSYDWTVTRAVARMEEALRGAVSDLLAARLRNLRLNAADVTLDPKTANPWLVLSDDGKRVSTGDVWKTLPDHPERFSKCTCVVGEQGFSTGRFYFEVQVGGKTSWSLGVARRSANRKGDITLCPRNGYWTIYLKEKNKLVAFDDRAVPLSRKQEPQSVGVFVDYEEGLVSFHDVDTAALIYSYSDCNFAESLHPFLSPYPSAGGGNSAPMIITPKSEMLK